MSHIMPILKPFPKEWLYPTSLDQAMRIQQELAQRVIRHDALPATVAYIGGADVSTTRFDPENQIYAAMVSLDVTGLAMLNSATVTGKSTLAYIPGFLAFREVPALVEAYKKLIPKPDLILVDGHGISHPRQLGIASHLGVVLDCPTIGVAKSILVGKPAGPLPEEPGSTVPLIWKKQEIAMCLRTRPRANPVYISIGHKVSLPTAIEWVLRCLKQYRLPEPTRIAHNTAGLYRKSCLAE